MLTYGPMVRVNLVLSNTNNNRNNKKNIVIYITSKINKPMDKEMKTL